MLFGLIATVMFGFVGNSQNLRANFLRGKTNLQVIEAFNSLTTDEKSALWLEKLDQLLTQNLSSQTLVLIGEMKTAHVRKDLNSFKSASLNLTKIIPEEDFIEMFLKLQDYNFSGTYTGITNVSQNLINEIEAVGLSFETYDPSDASKGKKPKCNCNWTCSWYGNYSTNCQETESGCGFFGNSFCNGHI